ncbi:hypothetical protein GCM10010495_82730 [Kitasatospora herbaricolor]|nr:hypothetical protein GCM10010495_82730 [Kitasatospora herbaricolor]
MINRVSSLDDFINVFVPMNKDFFIRGFLLGLFLDSFVGKVIFCNF